MCILGQKISHGKSRIYMIKPKEFWFTRLTEPSLCMDVCIPKYFIGQKFPNHEFWVSDQRFGLIVSFLSHILSILQYDKCNVVRVGILDQWNPSQNILTPFRIRKRNTF